MKATDLDIAMIRIAAQKILASGGRCSTELVALACGVPMTETPSVFRALDSDPALCRDDRATGGGYTIFRSKT